jgi:hypothetical protein
MEDPDEQIGADIVAKVWIYFLSLLALFHLSESEYFLRSLTCCEFSTIIFLCYVSFSFHKKNQES